MAFDFASDEKLLGIDDICAKLAISRTTLERLRNPQRRSALDQVRSMVGDSADDYSGMPTFPEPTITIGRSPRWSVSILNRWIASAPTVARILKNQP